MEGPMVKRIKTEVDTEVKTEVEVKVKTGIKNEVKMEVKKEVKMEDDFPKSLYITEAQQAITFVVAFGYEDLPGFKEPFRKFKADHVYQVFGEPGLIYGYRNLKITIHYLASTAKGYIYIQYADKSIKPPPDDVIAKLHDWLPPGYTLQLSECMRNILLDKPEVMFGKVIDHIKDIADDQVIYVVTHCDNNQAGFKEFHDRFQTYLVWFIEGANKIDLSEKRWKVFYIYEVRMLHGQKRICAVGFCSVYEFYHYPREIRPRISQCLILPPWQHRGVGAHTLGCIYRYYLNKPAFDITVEDPCRAFTRLRDGIDCRMAMHLTTFSVKKIMGPFNKQMIEEARGTFLFNKSQSRRIYEILHMAQILLRKDDNAMKAYVDQVQKRFQAPYVRMQKALEKKKWRKMVNIVKTEFDDVSGSIKQDEDQIRCNANVHICCIRESAETLIRKLSLTPGSEWPRHW